MGLAEGTGADVGGCGVFGGIAGGVGGGGGESGVREGGPEGERGEKGGKGRRCEGEKQRAWWVVRVVFHRIGVRG